MSRLVNKDGVTVSVADEKDGRYLAQGFEVVKGDKPVKSEPAAAKKAAAPKSEK